MDFSHIDKLSEIFLYKSPCGKVHPPRKIHRNTEEMEVIVSGYGTFFRDGQAYEAGPGSVLWYFEGDMVEVTSDQKNPYETIVFVYSVKSVAEKKMPFFSKWENQLSCEKFCRRALKHFLFEIDFSETLTHCSYARLVWESLEFERRQKRENIHPAIEKALGFMDDNFSAKIAIEDIALASGVSASHLHLLIKNELGISPFQYILKLRLEKARELLLSSAKPVKQICFETGFGDIKNFYSYFKKIHKTTPAEFRRSF